MRGGHNAKATKHLKLAGTFREDRHGDRVDSKYEGMPEQIKGLGKDGQQMWKLVVKHTPAEVLAGIDGPALFGLCRWWAMWRKYDRIANSAKAKPNDLYLAMGAWKQCNQLMIQFGMSPVARTRIKSGERSVDTSDPLSQMIANRGA